MKVLVLTTTFPRWKDDTTPTFVYELSKRLQENGLEIVILAPHHKGAKRFEIMDGMKVYRFPYFWPTIYQKLVYEGGVLPNLRRSHLAKIQLPLLLLAELVYAVKIIRRERIDLIHSHWIIPSGLVGAILQKIFKKPHITTAHAGDVFIMRNLKILNKVGSFVFKNSDKITANSNYTKNVIISIEDKAKYKVEIIPMGVDTSRFKYKKVSNLRDAFGAEYLILSVGRLVEKKGLKYLIIAMEDIIKEFPSVKLVIGGSGPEKDNLEKVTKSLNLKEKVIFVGYVKNPDLPEYYISSDIFVLPSIETKRGDTEGLGVVLLEAAACGTPIIGSNIGGITDIIKDGRSGFLVEPRNPKDIADKITKLLSDEKLRRRFSEESSNIVREGFSWDVVTDKFVKVYESLK